MSNLLDWRRGALLGVLALAIGIGWTIRGRSGSSEPTAPPPAPAADTPAPSAPPPEPAAPVHTPSELRPAAAPDAVANAVADAAERERDAAWETLRRTKSDSMEYLATQHGSLLMSRLYRAEDLNPGDTYLPPTTRALLDQIVAKYKATFAALDKRLAELSLHEADALRAQGALPTTDAVQLTASEKQEVTTSGKMAVDRLRARRPDATDDEVLVARRRGEAEQILRLKGGNVLLDNGNGTFSIASDKQMDAGTAANSEAERALLRLDRAMAVVAWFQQQGALTPHAAAALLEHYRSIAASGAKK